VLTFHSGTTLEEVAVIFDGDRAVTNILNDTSKAGSLSYTEDDKGVVVERLEHAGGPAKA
jgi:hypothetical protein